ncbi:MAG: hypothetical protein EA427_03245 [Spirochaetaceae bacterium]|nr:MAG: hypothetical protein EA427_03245 [Spirochaetaceae bacterium]
MRTMQRAMIFLLPALMILAGPAGLWSEELPAAEWAGLSAEEGWSLFSSDTDDTLAFEFTFGLTAQRMYEMLGPYESPELDRSLRGQRTPRSWYDTTEAILDYRSRYLSLFVDWAMINDERYDPSEPWMRGRYLYIKDAHVQVDRRPFLIKAGRTTQTDVIDSPYSLFVNANPIPAPQLETTYRGDFFFYTSRWVGLNRNSDKTYFGSGMDNPLYGQREPGAEGDQPIPMPGSGNAYEDVYPDGIPWADRGANFKVYGLNLADGWRFGLQESAVYLNQYFNPEFFLSPMPMYFTQIIVDGGNKPWGEDANSKHVLGFFADRTRPGSYLAGQILLDDFNPGNLAPTLDVDFMNRLAWSIGGYREYDFGQIGLYYAGSTKYTFSATSSAGIDRDVRTYDGADEVPLYYSRRPYPLTYFPAVEYPVKNGRRMPIDYRHNYLGYQHGENNMAIKIDYTNTFHPEERREIGFYSSLEYVINGAKSPANPWHEENHFRDIDEATRFLNDDLEHQVLLRARVERPVRIFGVPFTVFADGELGFIFNAMKLEPVFDRYDDRRTFDFDKLDDGRTREGDGDNPNIIDRNLVEPWIYRPQPGDHEVIWHLTLGITYRWQVK